MWDLPRPGLEPVSPALAGRFSTTAPPRKPCSVFLRARQFYHQIKYLSFIHITILLTSLCLRTHHLAMCSCFQSVSNTVGTRVSERNERPSLGDSEGGSIHLSGAGLACERWCFCHLSIQPSLLPRGSLVSEQSLASCHLGTWVVHPFSHRTRKAHQSLQSL